MKKRITAIIMSLIMVTALTAYFAPRVTAQADESNVTEEGMMVTPNLPTIQQTSPAAITVRSVPVEASDYYEFLYALQNADYGDTIIITGAIGIPAGTTILDYMGKNVTLRRGIPEARFTLGFTGGTVTSTITNLTFDGAGLYSESPFVSVFHHAIFDNVSFINCVNLGNGGAIGIASAVVTFTNCRFENNRSGQLGGHIYIGADATVNVNGSIFTNASSRHRGGAINNTAVLTITDSVITNNSTDGSGGGISSTGALTVTNSKIYGNTAQQGGSDIASGNWATLTLSDNLNTLTSLFADSGLIPIGWVSDYRITIPSTVEAPQFIGLRMEFVGEPEIIVIVETVCVNVYVPIVETVYVAEYVYVYMTETVYVNVYIPQNVYITERIYIYVTDTEYIYIGERVYIYRNVYVEERVYVPQNVYITERIYVPRNVYISESERVYITDTTVERLYIPYRIYIEPELEIPPPTPTLTPDESELEPMGDIWRLVRGDAIIDPERRNYVTWFGDSHAGRDAPINRAQAAQVIFRLLTNDSLQAVYAEAGTFIDVSPYAWYSTFVNTLQNAGVIAGVGGDLFLPERNLTRAEMVSLFARFVEPQAAPSVHFEHWASGAFQTAVSLGWLPHTSDFNHNAEVTIQEFVDFVLVVLDWSMN